MDPPPTRVFQDFSADLFSHGGHYFLAYADRLSGWTTVEMWNKDPTAREVAKAVAGNFVDLGVPVRFRSDGGPQFTGSEFTQFLRRWGVTGVLSTPHYRQSNGHAEAAVKAMKSLVKKTVNGGRLDDEKFLHALLEWRNTPRNDGMSPAQILFGHSLRTLIPAHHRSFAPKWQTSMEDRDRNATELKEAAIERYNKNARPLPSIKIGTTVRIQDPTSKLWDRSGIVVSVGKNRDYRVKQPSGRTLWRNRRFLREDRTAEPPTDQPDVCVPAADKPTSEGGKEEKKNGRKKKTVQFQDQPAPRRSTRTRTPREM